VTLSTRPQERHDDDEMHRRLVDILGAPYWLTTVLDAPTATRLACDRMAQGREAVTFTDASGAHVVAWGARAR